MGHNPDYRQLLDLLRHRTEHAIDCDISRYPSSNLQDPDYAECTCGLKRARTLLANPDLIVTDVQGLAAAMTARLYDGIEEPYDNEQREMQHEVHLLEAHAIAAALREPQP